MLKRKSMLYIIKLKNQIAVKIVLFVYVIAYMGATYNHANDIMRYGLFGYQRINSDVSLALNIYWTLLVFFDPLAIVLLFFNVNLGLLLYGIVILSDVVINYIFVIVNYGIGSVLNFGQICQLLFLTFYIITAPFVYKKAR